MDISQSEPGHSRTPSNADTASVDSTQVLPPTQVVGANHNVILPLQYLPLPTMNSLQESLPPTTRQEGPVVDIEIPPSFMQAFNYHALARNSLQAGPNQLIVKLQESVKEKRNMTVETARLSEKLSQLEVSNNDLGNLLAGERKECLNKQGELDDSNVKLDDMRAQAKQREMILKKERADGIAKAMKIQEQEKAIAEIQKKLEETSNELKTVMDKKRQIVDEYYESLTRPTLINKLLAEKLAKNPIELTSQVKVNTIEANNISEQPQSYQVKHPSSPGTTMSTYYGVMTRSKTRKQLAESKQGLK